jgi:hypothetical protein
MDDKREVANSGEEQSCLARVLSDELIEEGRRRLTKGRWLFHDEKGNVNNPVSRRGVAVEESAG